MSCSMRKVALISEHAVGAAGALVDVRDEVREEHSTDLAVTGHVVFVFVVDAARNVHDLTGRSLAVAQVA
jgi:hypothetical protein